MAFPTAPTEAGGDKIHFLTTDGNAAAGWIAIDTGTSGTGANTLGFAGIATHVEDDAVGSPGGLSTTSVPLVLMGAARDDVLSAVTPAEGDAIRARGDAFGALWVAAKKPEGKVTYRVAFKGLSGPTGVAVRLAGNASTTVRVTKVQIAKPSVAQAPLRMVKTSAAATGGSATTPTPIPLDANNAAASSVISLYTSAPTGGTEVGTGSIYESDIGTGDVLFETFGDEQNTQAVVLRGTAQNLEIDLSAAAAIDGYLEWTEE